MGHILPRIRTNNHLGILNMTNCHILDGMLGTTQTLCSTTEGAYFINITPGSEDTPVNSGSALIGEVSDLSNDPIFPFNYDFEGDIRSYWDVGADEL